LFITTHSAWVAFRTLGSTTFQGLSPCGHDASHFGIFLLELVFISVNGRRASNISFSASISRANFHIRSSPQFHHWREDGLFKLARLHSMHHSSIKIDRFTTMKIKSFHLLWHSQQSGWLQKNEFPSISIHRIASSAPIARALWKSWLRLGFSSNIKDSKFFLS